MCSHPTGQDLRLATELCEDYETCVTEGIPPGRTVAICQSWLISVQRKVAGHEHYVTVTEVGGVEEIVGQSFAAKSTLSTAQSSSRGTAKSMSIYAVDKHNRPLSGKRQCSSCNRIVLQPLPPETYRILTTLLFSEKTNASLETVVYRP